MKRFIGFVLGFWVLLIVHSSLYAENNCTKILAYKDGFYFKDDGELYTDKRCNNSIGYLEKQGNEYYAQCFTHGRRFFSVVENAINFILECEYSVKRNKKTVKYFMDKALSNTVNKNYIKSIENLKKALLLSKNKENIFIADINQYIALNYELMGNNSRAIQWYKKTLSILKNESNNEEILLFYIKIATLYKELNKYKKALFYYKKASKFLEKFPKYIDLNHTNLYGNMGQVYYGIGDYQNALFSYKKVLKECTKGLNQNNLCKRQAYYDIGITYMEIGNYKKSLKFYTKALKIAKKSKNIANESTILSTIAMVHGKLGNPHKSLNIYLETLKIYKDILEKIMKILPHYMIL